MTFAPIIGECPICRRSSEFPPLGTTGGGGQLPDSSLVIETQKQRIAALEAKVLELEAELETERMRLAGCGVAALGYFDGCKDEYKSASLSDVLQLRDQLTASRQQVEQLAEALQAARNHLDWIGWGDSYERECARESGLNEQIEKVLFTIQQETKERP